MSLGNIVADPSFERGHYHQLATSELDKLDDAEALFERGRRLRYGIGVAEDKGVGLKLIIESAKLGHPVALAYCFATGQGTKQNVYRAFELYRASAERGHASGSICFCDRASNTNKPQKAQNSLGWYFDNGEGVEKNEREAVHWFRAAANQNDAGAQCNLGVCYQNGTGIEKNVLIAACLFQMAIENGFQYARNNLANLKLSKVSLAFKSS
jgi:TPR repeat protein